MGELDDEALLNSVQLACKFGKVCSLISRQVYQYLLDKAHDRTLAAAFNLLKTVSSMQNCFYMLE
jgi:hypothetical protein